MTKLQSVPCYIRNGGVHNILNLPLGINARATLAKICKELLITQKTLQTFCACHVSQAELQLLSGLVKILQTDLRPKANREAVRVCLSENEKNLNRSKREAGKDEVVNLVSLSVSVGLIALLFLFGAHVEYLETLQ